MTEISIPELKKANGVWEREKGAKVPGALLVLLGKLRTALDHVAIPVFDPEKTYTLEGYQQKQDEVFSENELNKQPPVPLTVDISIDIFGSGEAHLCHSTQLVDIYFNEDFNKLIIGKRGKGFGFNSFYGFVFSFSRVWSRLMVENNEGENFLKEVFSTLNEQDDMSGYRRLGYLVIIKVIEEKTGLSFDDIKMELVYPYLPPEDIIQEEWGDDRSHVEMLEKAFRHENLEFLFYQGDCFHIRFGEKEFVLAAYYSEDGEDAVIEIWLPEGDEPLTTASTSKELIEKLSEL